MLFRHWVELATPTTIMVFVLFYLLEKNIIAMHKHNLKQSNEGNSLLLLCS